MLPKYTVNMMVVEGPAPALPAATPEEVHALPSQNNASPETTTISHIFAFCTCSPYLLGPSAGGAATPTSPWRDHIAGSVCHPGPRAQTPGILKAVVHRSRILLQSPRPPAGPRKRDVAGRFPSLHTAAGPPGTSYPPGRLPHLQSLLPPNRRKREMTRNMRHRPDMYSVDPSPSTKTP